MRRDPKKGGTFRFNGNPHVHSTSLRPLTIEDLRASVAELEAKLAHPADPDDKKWVERWLRRYQSELAKKLDGLSLKNEERSKSKSRRQRRT